MGPEFMAFDERVAVHYEAWYETLPGQRVDALEGAALQRLLQHFPEAHSVLEVGAGTGHFTRWSRERGLAAVGLDLSAAMLVQAEKLNGVTMVQGDACRLPFTRSAFDLIAFVTTLEFLPCPREAPRDGLRVARQGMLLGVLNRWSPLGVRRRLEGICHHSIYNEAHFYGVRELQRLLWSLTDEQADLVRETTLLPNWWPKRATNQPWGGFIAMALLTPERQRRGCQTE